MVWSGARRADAAKTAGMTDHSLRAALRKPHVIGFYRSELGVLRESGRARIFHRLEALAEQDDNKAAAVKACQVLEQIADDPVKSGSRGGSTQPGFVIQIVNAPAVPAPQQTIDVTPAPVQQTEGVAHIEADKAELSEQEQ
jgi:hypothetical protein